MKNGVLPVTFAGNCSLTILSKEMSVPFVKPNSWIVPTTVASGLDTVLIVLVEFCIVKALWPELSGVVDAANVAFRFGVTIV